jgi:hypothetical protein
MELMISFQLPCLSGSSMTTTSMLSQVSSSPELGYLGISAIMYPRDCFSITILIHFLPSGFQFLASLIHSLLHFSISTVTTTTPLIVGSKRFIISNSTNILLCYSHPATQDEGYTILFSSSCHSRHNRFGSSSAASISHYFLRI